MIGPGVIKALSGTATCLVAMMLLAAGTLAQEPSPEESTGFGKGAIEEPDASFAARPRTPIYRAFLPVRVDLSRFFPTPGAQGKQASCVGWAVGYAARAYYAISLEGRAASPAHIPSPSYIYNSIVAPSGQCDAGSSIPDALNLLKQGSLSLAQLPYDPKRCSAPTPPQRAAATDFRISSWLAVDPQSPDQVKAQLSQGHPVVVSLVSRPAFVRLRSDRIYDSSAETSDGSHALAVVGYDDQRQAFKVINSWGTRWGNGGYGWIGYRAFVRDVRRAYMMRVAGKEPLAPMPAPAPRPAPAPPPVSFDFVRCGLVDVVPSAEGPRVEGFVGTLTELNQVKERARALKAARIDVVLRPWPQCEALMTLQRGLRAADRPQIRVVHATAGAELPAGANLVIEIESPSTPSFLHVTYIQADGKAVHLVQSGATTLATIAPRSKLTLGDGRDGGPHFTVSPPFGDEIVVAVASAAPLFAEPRPTTETEREFLTALRAALMARPDPALAERVFTASYDAVKTVERKP